ncbi:hypothetical protein B9C88_21740 [Brevibacillus laterosporus]|nr:hypothetical protein B9C88_21740 [Brevibacillus laterosporus]
MKTIKLSKISIIVMVITFLILIINIPTVGVNSYFWTVISIIVGTLIFGFIIEFILSLFNKK